MTAALIPAAGRLEEDNGWKPMEAIGDTSPIKQIIMVFKQVGVERIVVVTGFEAETLERHCAHMGVVFLRNDDYGTSDMLSSVKIGLNYLKGKCGKAYISPADIPFISIETVRSMDDAQEPVVIPMYNNKTGHPLLLSESLFDDVIAYQGSGGLEGALSGGNIQRRFFEVADEGILAGFRYDSAETGIEERSVRRITPDVRIRLFAEKAFFGPGTFQLLNLTNETGSLKEAARQMGVSYSKAWKMITDVEKQLGLTVLMSRQGGRQGGGSEITAEGLTFMKRYEAFASECNEVIMQAYDKHFPND